MVGAEQRPEIEQFAEESGQPVDAVSIPFDIEGNIRVFIEEARRTWKGDFNAALWLRGEMEGILGRMVVTDTPEETTTFFNDLLRAWDVTAFSAYDSDTQATVTSELYTYIMGEDRENIILNAQGVQLLDWMAAATNMPNYTPGQKVIELSRVIDLSPMD